MIECEQVAYEKDTSHVYKYYVRPKAGGPPVAQFRRKEDAICFAGMLPAIVIMKKVLHKSKKMIVMLKQGDLFDE